MTRFAAAALLAFCALSEPVSAQTTDLDLIWAMGEVGEELQTCSVYFTVVLGCLAHQEPALSETYDQSAKRLALLGASSKLAAGVSEQTYLAFSDLLFKHMKNAMGGNCTNISVLLQRYSDFCQRLGENTDARLMEWVECLRSKQKTCGGPGVP
jgi:hypothetical protein